MDQTVVIWSGEFGRLPVSQNGTGRDHNRNALSPRLAGGEFKAGYIHGETVEVGYKAAVDRVSIADLHGTTLPQMGFAHELLSSRQASHDDTLTDASLTKTRVMNKLLNKLRCDLLAT